MTGAAHPVAEALVELVHRLLQAAVDARTRKLAHQSQVRGKLTVSAEQLLDRSITPFDIFAVMRRAQPPVTQHSQPQW
ncbi:hypothetical protein D3C85_1788100 [compost metagenome]